jgi:hypothetical protein
MMREAIANGALAEGRRQAQDRGSYRFVVSPFWREAEEEQERGRREGNLYQRRAEFGNPDLRQIQDALAQTNYHGGKAAQKLAQQGQALFADAMSSDNATGAEGGGQKLIRPTLRRLSSCELESLSELFLW